MSRNIRHYLKAGTAQLHAALDRRMGPLVSGNAADYGCFLRIQYRARRPIEDWIGCTQSRLAAPPRQLALIADDLRSLGSEIPPTPAEWVLPRGGNALGLFWVLAGSALGNRMLCTRLEQSAPELPRAFLADRSAAAYWTTLRPRLEAVPVADESETALAAARAVFAHFLDVAESECLREAA